MLSLILSACGLAIWIFLFPASVSDTDSQLASIVPASLSFAQIVSFAGMMGYASFQLNDIGSKTQNSHVSKNLWIPTVSTFVSVVIILIVHYGAWVPVPIAVVLVSPCVVLPPLIYRVSHNLRFTIEKNEIPLFSIEEVCRIKDNILLSYLVQQFLQRYPNAHAYIYKSGYPYSSGGIFLHNYETMFTPNPTRLEVTLDCPFTSRTGVLAEGRETFHAYLARHLPDGSIISPLPQSNWNDWLIGLQKKEWFQRIEQLDAMKPQLPNMGDLPYQFHTQYQMRQEIALR